MQLQQTWCIHLISSLLSLPLVTSHRFSQSQPELVTEHFGMKWLNNFRFNYLGAAWFGAAFMQTPKFSYPSMDSYSSLVSKLTFDLVNPSYYSKKIPKNPLINSDHNMTLHYCIILQINIVISLRYFLQMTICHKNN